MTRHPGKPIGYQLQQQLHQPTQATHPVRYKVWGWVWTPVWRQVRDPVWVQAFDQLKEERKHDQTSR